MPEIFRRRSTPPILALSAVAALVVFFVLLNGGGSQGADNPGLADYMPPDTVAYAETDLRPDGRAEAEVDRVVRTLTGSSLRSALDEALGRTKGPAVDYREDVEPWLAGPVAVSAGDSRSEFALVAETGDAEAAGDFAGKLENDDSLPDGARAEVVGNALVVARSQAWLDQISEAHAGDSLAGTALFSDSMGSVPEGGLASLFISNAALLDSFEDGDAAVAQVIETLGVDPQGTATAMTLAVDGDSVSLQGSSGLVGGGEVTGAGELIESFPADSLIAAGSGDVGESLGNLIEAAGQTGRSPEGSTPEQSGPGGEADGIEDLFGQASAFGIDLPALVESLETAGVFVTGDSRGNMGGALVATTDDPDLVRDSIQSISTLGAFAGGDLFKALPGDLDGFSIKLPGMPSGRVAIASGGDRLVIALGVEAARAGLDPAQRTLVDTDLYRRSTSGLSGEQIGLFVTPSALAPLVGDKGRSHGGLRGGSKAGAERLKVLVEGIETIVAGSGEDGSFEIELGLKD